MFKVSIPKLTQEEIMARYAKVRPVMTKDGKIYPLKEYTPHEIMKTSYYLEREKDILKEEAKYLVPIPNSDFYCLHSYGYYGLFKPSVAEVLSQLSEQQLFHADAFEIVATPETPNDFSKDEISAIAFKNGYHVSKVRLYTLKR